MNKSDQINELSTALAKAQGEMTAAKMDSVNPHFRNKFASLASFQESYKGPCSKNGLAITQSLESDQGEYFVETMMMHSSGQWISSKIKLILTKNDMQGLGSATTYGKRYAVCAMLGISAADEDDDGNHASQVSDTIVNPSKPFNIYSSKPTEKQLKRLFAITKAANWDNDKVRNFMNQRFNKIASTELTLQEYEELCDQIEKHPVKAVKNNDEDMDFPFEDK